MKWLINTGAVIAGLLLGGIVISIVDSINAQFYPMPDGLSLKDSSGMKEWIGTLPAPAFAMLVVAWVLGTLTGVFVGRRFANNRSQLPGVFVAAAFLIATIINLLMMPHPLWLWPVAFVCLPVAAVLGLVMAAPASYQVTASRLIKAPLQDVFATLSQVEQFSKAVPGIKSIEFLSEQQHGVGTRFRETRLMHGKEATTELEVTELVVNSSIRMVSDAGGTVWDTVFCVQDSQAGVQLDMKMDARPHAWPAKIITPCILAMVDKAVQSDMDSIKGYCEQQPS